MFRFILVCAGVLGLLGGIAVLSFMNNVKIKSTVAQVRKETVRKNIAEYAKRKKAVEIQKTEIIGPLDVAADIDVEVDEDDPRYGRSQKSIEQEFASEDGAESYQMEMATVDRYEDYSHRPLSEDLKEGSKAFVDRFLERMSEIRHLKNSEHQVRILKIIELELFMLKREKMIHKDVAAWAKTEVQNLRAQLDRAVSSAQKK